MSLVALNMPYFPDPSIGRPVAFGSIYVGEPDLDPEIVANQKTISIRQEDGTEIPVSQPVLTGAGGVPMYAGSPVQIMVDGDYSLKVLNQSGTQVYYIDSAVNLNPSSVLNIFGAYDTIADLRNAAIYTNANAYVKGYSTVGDGGHGNFLWDSSDLSSEVAADTQSGVYVAPTSDLTGASGAWVRECSGTVNVRWFGVVADETDETASIQNALDFVSSSTKVDTLYFPKGHYGITSIEISDYVNVVGDGSTSTIFISLTERSDGAIILNASDSLSRSYISDIGLSRLGSPRTGVGLWMKYYIRNKIERVTVKGFGVGVDTQGASYSSTFDTCVVEYNDIGFYHQAASASFVKITDQTEPYDRTQSGFNGGSVRSSEIRQNNYGVVFGDYATIPGFHSTNVTYDSCIIEGNNVRAIVTASAQANVNIINCYFESNSRTVDLISASDFIADPTGYTIEDVAAHIISFSSSEAQESRVNINNCYFQNAAGELGIAYLNDMALTSINISGNQGFMDGMYLRQYANTTRTKNTAIGPNFFNNTFVDGDLSKIPINGLLVGSEFRKAYTNTVFDGGRTRREYHNVTATYATATKLVAIVTWDVPFGSIRHSSCELTSVSCATVNIDRVLIARRINTNTGCTIIITHADPINSFQSGDTALVDVMAFQD